MGVLFNINIRNDVEVLIIKKIDDAEEMLLAYSIRTEVFTNEQGVNVDIERDACDINAVHVLATIDKVPVGTGRIVFHEGMAKIGRVAVLKAYRGQGLGLKICQELIEIARVQGAHRAMLHAQIDAKDFYTKMGFIPVGTEFIEADIRHIKMEREIK